MAEQTKTAQTTGPPAKAAPTQLAKRGEVAPARPAQVLDLEAAIRSKMTAVSRKDFYKVGWSKEEGDVLAPSARILQKWSNESEAPISTRIIRSETTPEGCSVTVRGWIGDETHPKVVKEESMSMNWAHELEWLLAEAVAKGIRLDPYSSVVTKPPFDLTDPDQFGVSRIVLRDPTHQLHVLTQWYRCKRFGERVCITKLESRIHKKLLSGEWRDEEEIDHEKQEIEAVAAEKGLTQVTSGTGNGDGASKSPPVERLIPQGAQPEAGKAVSPMAVTSLVTRFKDLGENFPLPQGVDHKQFLLYAAMGLMFERGAQIPEAKLEAMTPADSGKLWEMVGKVSHGDEEALKAIDLLHTSGKKVVEALSKRGKP
jgi:hypothetical protein